jgi:hypothetical protein
MVPRRMIHGEPFVPIIYTPEGPIKACPVFCY